MPSNPTEPSKAVILAAGRGTRMADLTQELPKPMLRVRGVPILEHIIRGLIGCGIRDLCVITGWRAEAIEDYFGDGSRVGARMIYRRQTTQDGTGKAPELARDFVGPSSFLLTYGDILVPPENYGRMLVRFQEGRYAGLITVTAGQDVRKGAISFFDDQFCLKRLIEKPSPEQLDELSNQGWIQPGQPLWYNAGIYVFQPLLFDFTARLQKSPRGEYELTDAVSALVTAGHRLAGFPIQGQWVDVRDPHVLASLESPAEGGPFLPAR